MATLAHAGAAPVVGVNEVTIFGHLVLLRLTQHTCRNGKRNSKLATSEKILTVRQGSQMMRAMDKIVEKETVAQFIKRIDRAKFCRETQYSQSVISKAITRNDLSPRWYWRIKAYCDRYGYDLPEYLFARDEPALIGLNPEEANG